MKKFLIILLIIATLGLGAIGISYSIKNKDVSVDTSGSLQEETTTTDDVSLSKIEELTQQVNTYAKEVSTLRSYVAELEQSEEDNQVIIDGLEEVITNKTNELEAVRLELQTLQEEYDKLQADYTELENQYSASQMDTQTLLGLYDGSVTELVIPEGVTTIRPYAFYKLTNLTSVQLPSTIETIGTSAFNGCSNLSSVNFPELSNLSIIDRLAFSECNLERVEFSESSPKICDYAFSDNISLNNVYLPNIEELDVCAFLDSVINTCYVSSSTLTTTGLLTDYVKGSLEITLNHSNDFTIETICSNMCITSNGRVLISPYYEDGITSCFSAKNQNLFVNSPIVAFGGINTGYSGCSVLISCDEFQLIHASVASEILDVTYNLEVDTTMITNPNFTTMNLYNVGHAKFNIKSGGFLPSCFFDYITYSAVDSTFAMLEINSLDAEVLSLNNALGTLNFPQLVLSGNIEIGMGFGFVTEDCSLTSLVLGANVTFAEELVEYIFPETIGMLVLYHDTYQGYFNNAVSIGTLIVKDQVIDEYRNEEGYSSIVDDFVAFSDWGVDINATDFEPLPESV